MTSKILPTPEYLRKRLRCEPETGKLFWLDCDEKQQRWRTAWAGKEAFTALDRGGYKHGCIDFLKLRAHRVIWAMHYGVWPSDEIDHINGVRDDNRIGNLRVVSRHENMRNAAMHKNNTSGVCGVSWSKACCKWRAHIMVDRKQIHLGVFDDVADAVAARLAAEREYGYTDRHGKEPAIRYGVR